MSRKIRKAVASTLALAMMAGNVSSMPAGQLASIVQAAEAGATVSVKAPTEVKAGETFTVECNISDNADGFTALVAWINFNKDVFEPVKWEYGVDDEDHDIVQNMNEPSLKYHSPAMASDINSIVQLYFNQSQDSNLKGDVCMSKITFKVADNAPSGNYTIDVDGEPDKTLATQNRISSSREVVECATKYVDATIKVNGAGEASTPTQAPATQAPATQAPATQAPVTGQLSGKVADATGKTGETIKTTLSVSGASVAGFTANLSFDTAALELSSASASGWDVEVNGTQLVALANPYQDNSSATVNLEFKAKSAGSHKVEVKALEGATKGESVVAGSGAGAGTLTVSGEGSQTPATSAPSTPTQAPPSNADAIQIELGTVTDAEPGTTVSVPVYAKNIGKGFSTVQFDYTISGGLKVEKVNKGDISGSWTVGTENPTVQFLEADGNNISGEGIIGKLRIAIPADAKDVTYTISASSFEGSYYDAAADKQVPLSGSAFGGVAGKIVVGNGGGEVTPDPTQTPATQAPATSAPSTPTQAPPSNADAIQIELGTVTDAEAGTTVSVPVYAKNIGKGFSTVQFDYKIDGGLKVEKVNKGDISGSWTVGTENPTVQFLEADGNNISGEGIIGKLRIAIPADAKDVTYTITASNFEGSYYDAAADRQVPLDAAAFSGVVGKIVVGNGGTSAGDNQGTTPTQTPATSAPSTPTTVPVPTQAPNANSDKQPEADAKDPDGIKGMTLNAGKYKVAKAGDTFTLKVNITDNEEGFNALIAWLDIDTNVFELVEKTAGDVDDKDNEDSDAFNNLNFTEYKKPNTSDLLTLVHLYDDTNNTKGDMVLSSIELKVKDGVEDGYYTIPFDAVGDPGRAMSNRIITKDGGRTPIVLNPHYVGAVVQVGDATPATSAPATSAPATSTPATSTPATSAPATSAPATSAPATSAPATSAPSTPTEKPPVADAIQIELGTVTDAEPGTTVSVPVYAKNIGKGFSTVQFDYKIDGGLKVEKVNKGDISGSWTVGTENPTVQFLEADGNNISGEGIIGKLRITVPADAKDVTYTITASNFEGSYYDAAADRQVPLDASAFSGVVGKIVVGNGGENTPSDPATSAPATSTPATSTPATSAPATSAPATTVPVPTQAPNTNSDKQPEDDAKDPEGIKGMTLNAGKYKVAKAGDTFTLKVNITDNEEGFNALIAWLDIDTNVFELVEKTAGDVDDKDNEDSDAFNNLNFTEYKKPGTSDLLTLVHLYDDTNNTKGDMVLSSIELKVKDGVKDGYYTIPFDAVGDPGRAMSNRIITKDGGRTPIVLNPHYIGAVVQVGDVTPATSAPATSTPATSAPATSAPATSAPSTPTEKPPVSDGIQIVIGEVADAEPGTTVSVPVYAKNVGNGFSTVQFDYKIDGGLKVDKVNKGDISGSWTVGTENPTLQFLEADGNNVKEEGIIGKLRITIPADAEPGAEYTITLSNFEGSTYDEAGDRQIPLENDAFAGVSGKIVVKGGTTPTTPPTTPDDELNYDVNGDGVVNTGDIVAIKKYLLLVADKSTVPNGDINKDGAINAIDNVRILKYIIEH